MSYQVISPFFDKDDMKNYRFQRGEKALIYRFCESPGDYPPIWPTMIVMVLNDGRWLYAQPPTHFYSKNNMPEPGTDWRLGKYWPQVFEKINRNNFLQSVGYWHTSHGLSTNVSQIERVCVDLNNRDDVNNEAQRIGDSDQCFVYPLLPEGVSLKRYLGEILVLEAMVQVKLWEKAGREGIKLPPVPLSV